ncbi:enoyl-CoA hydratase [Bordetella sp. 2513F-2]
MQDSPLLIHADDGVRVLTLNRPQRRNALSLELYDRLLDALQQAANDPDVGAVVLTGAGGAFCAGGDVSRMATGEVPRFEQKVASLRRRSRICELLHAMPQPTVAMLRGPAVGAGLSLALACDLRIGDTSTRLRTGFLQVGLPGDFGGHYFLPRLVGMAKARELYLASPMLDAASALELGLLNQVCQPEALEPCVMELARRWAQGPRTALAYMKQNLNQGLDASLAEVLDGEAWRHVRCTETEDHKEAARAFVEKRAAQFRRSAQTREG